LGDALRNLSFSVRAGEKVGIVGRTGSGKSTLLLALLRILEPRTGTIFIDGLDYTGFDLSSLRANVTVILQEHFLFAGTVRAVNLTSCRTSTLLTSTLMRQSQIHLIYAEFGKDCDENRVSILGSQKAGKISVLARGSC
jgi:ABC-type multidrug transport system fused ATPase/permease subunit